MTTYDKATIAEMLDGKLPWDSLKSMMSSYKDVDRFDKCVEVLQERVDWDDKILLPLGPRLFIVRKANGSIVTKSVSGYEFGDYRKNWKLGAWIYVRNTHESFQEVYTEMAYGDPEWMEMREYYDPVDGSLLDVEVVPPGYPIVHNFDPDLEGFYKEWLGRPLP
ncbi:MAG: acetone carboxylase subunit gamma [Cupriavidus sp.]|nr:acetone carboxylase subunit gamma [Cupriavidus sp.]